MERGNAGRWAGWDDVIQSVGISREFDDEDAVSRAVIELKCVTHTASATTMSER